LHSSFNGDATLTDGSVAGDQVVTVRHLYGVLERKGTRASERLSRRAMPATTGPVGLLPMLFGTVLGMANDVVEQIAQRHAQTLHCEEHERDAKRNLV
jgi:hypothetical protein